MTTSQEQYFEKTLQECAALLARWQDAKALMRELTVSHKSLRLLLTRGEGAGNLLVSCLDPARIKGPVAWEHSEISVSRAPLPASREDGFCIVDKNADMEILCGGIEVRENVKVY